MIVNINLNSFNRNLKTINNNNKIVCKKFSHLIKTIYEQFIKIIKNIKIINRGFKYIKIIKKTLVSRC